MKKIASAVLAAALAVNVAGQASAAEVKLPQGTIEQVKKIDVNSLWKTVDTFKGTVQLKDAKYKVDYKEEKGIVKVTIQKESGNKTIEVTGEEASKKVIDFVKNLDLSMNLSKEEVIKRLSDALGVKPGDVQRANASVGFSNLAAVDFSFKKGEKSAVINPYNISKLYMKVEDKNGYYYHVTYLAHGDSIKAVIQKKTAEGTKEYKGIYALLEALKIKDRIIPGKDVTWNGYLDQLSKALGIKVTDITKVEVQSQFENNTKADIHFER
ncbi:YusW family protein [Bacillus sp. FJAT-42376]|uniref:YusW family protein n=1 Tax=Bacillus sp. FJAT-42376 TaxID=2014076 RepID=UPI0013DE663E|nr:YusW family protein [Bacillus sp. FJAT-42376]